MHGAWCWEKVVPLLRKAGNSVIALDLPGMSPADSIAAKDVTLKMVADFVAGVVRAQAERVVLVGHSMGGLTIGEAAERVPDHLVGLVYLSAVLLPSGETMFGELEHLGRLEHAERLRFDDSMEAATISEDGTVMMCNKAVAPELFYNLCDPDDVERAVARLVPQPIKPGLEPTTVTPQRFGRVPRAYIECLRDHALPLAIQRLLQRNWPCDPVFTMDTDHSPFFCAPDELARHLISAAEAFARN